MSNAGSQPTYFHIRNRTGAEAAETPTCIVDIYDVLFFWVSITEDNSLKHTNRASEGSVTGLWLLVPSTKLFLFYREGVGLPDLSCYSVEVLGCQILIFWSLCVSLSDHYQPAKSTCSVCVCMRAHSVLMQSYVFEWVHICIKKTESVMKERFFLDFPRFVSNSTSAFEA